MIYTTLPRGHVLGTLLSRGLIEVTCLSILYIYIYIYTVSTPYAVTDICTCMYRVDCQLPMLVDWKVFFLSPELHGCFQLKKFKNYICKDLKIMK
jgi:hypothetical protein